MERYNSHRTNQGKYCKGRTPMETFEAGIEKCQQYLPYEKIRELKSEKK